MFLWTSQMLANNCTWQWILWKRVVLPFRKTWLELCKLIGEVSNGSTEDPVSWESWPFPIQNCDVVFHFGYLFSLCELMVYFLFWEVYKSERKFYPSFSHSLFYTTLWWVVYGTTKKKELFISLFYLYTKYILVSYLPYDSQNNILVYCDVSDYSTLVFSFLQLIFE